MAMRRIDTVLRQRKTLAVLGVLVLVVVGTIVALGRDPGAGSGGPGGQARSDLNPTAAGWPAEPPARVCGNQAILGKGPAEPPQGAVVIPAGDNSSLELDLQAENTTFWFAPGVHTLSPDEFGQIIPGSGSTFVGAPGAVLDGKRINRYAFTGEADRVTIRYLTVRNFVAPMNEGVVNHNDGTNWLVEYSTITENEGAGLMAGAPGNTYRYNCIKDNGQYGINACCGTAAEPVENLVLDHNEITGNNTGDWENQVEGCGCTGGVKFWINDNVTVTNNWVHDNRGTGLWLDNNNSGFVIEHNYIANNDGNAIFLEAGYDARVRYNNIKRNAIVTGREFQSRADPFPIGAIYVSENGSPRGYGLKSVPTVISHNNFENNWGGVTLWESADRYCGSTAHTHPPFCTIKVDLYDDAQCETDVEDVIPESIGDKYRCRWSTENNVVENNVFRIDKDAIGEGCANRDYCGLNGLFAGYGTFPGFPGYEVMWRATFEQGNVFRNNQYHGDWQFAGFQPSKPNGGRVSWEEWTSPAPAVPEGFTHDNRPETFGQDQGSTYSITP
ncbi:hypothetical protein BAY59_36400 [Prauserella coralliicola]|nr:hypothetical protein BAY59_36400 [Prauserella coralliicola]